MTGEVHYWRERLGTSVALLMMLFLWFAGPSPFRLLEGCHFDVNYQDEWRAARARPLTIFEAQQLAQWPGLRQPAPVIVWTDTVLCYHYASELAR